MGKNRLTRILLRLASWSKIDPLSLAYHNMGILKCDDLENSGEEFVINTVLKRLLHESKPVLFDVGANIGDYSRRLRITFPFAQIHAFEPNEYSFEILKKGLSDLGIQCHKMSLGKEVGSQRLFTYASELTSQHASVYKEVFSEIHKSNNTVEFWSEMTTIDRFCCQEDIQYVDFLKIDTEGSELAVLQGATQMIASGRIRVIQFEFNEMNVVSRSFLRDFYNILPAYCFYRVNTKRLIPLGGYNTANEIFKYQNIIAILETQKND